MAEEDFITTSGIERLDDFSTSRVDAIRTTIEDAFVHSPLPASIRYARVKNAKRTEPASFTDEFGEEEFFPAQPGLGAKEFSVDEANKLGEPFGATFDEPITKPAIDIILQAKRADNVRKLTLERSPGGVLQGGGQFIAGLMTSVVDPLNVASAFIPVVGTGRFASLVAKHGLTKARLIQGGVEGAVGATLLEPIILAAASEEQLDYTLYDSLINVAFGTALGGGLHAGFGKLGDISRRREARRRLARDTVDISDDLRKELGDVLEGFPDVRKDLPALDDALDPADDLGARLSEVPKEVLADALRYGNAELSTGLHVHAFDDIIEPNESFQRSGTDQSADVQPIITESDFANIQDTAIPTDDGFVYHATNAENAQDIADSGIIDIHDPDFGTAQDVWPDGSTEARAYFTKTGENTSIFAPEDGKSVVVRVPIADAPVRAESGTGDLFSTAPVSVGKAEFLGSDGNWHPLIRTEDVASTNPVGTTVDGKSQFTPQVSDAFNALAGGQRGDPEIAMLRVQRANGGGILNDTVEHVGDITHRMSEFADKPSYSGFEFVKPKVELGIRRLGQGFGFEKEHGQNLKVNAEALNKSLTEHTANVDKSLSAYADEHSKLIVYNRAQWLARESAVAIGRKNFDEALVHLRELDKLIPDSASYDRVANQVNLDSSGKPIPFDPNRPEIESDDVLGSILKDFETQPVGTTVDSVDNAQARIERAAARAVDPRNQRNLDFDASARTDALLKSHPKGSTVEEMAELDTEARSAVEDRIAVLTDTDRAELVELGFIDEDGNLSAGIDLEGNRVNLSALDDEVQQATDLNEKLLAWTNCVVRG